MYIKEWIDQLSKREKRILGAATLLSLATFIFFITVPLGKRQAYFKTFDKWKSVGIDYSRAKPELDETEKEWENWKNAASDLDKLESYLYGSDQILMRIRTDLEKIFAECRIKRPEITYAYNDLSEEGVRQVSMNFSTSVSYPQLRQLIHSIETFPKLLVLERIQFLDVPKGGAEIKIRIHLAVYYEV